MANNFDSLDCEEYSQDDFKSSVKPYSFEPRKKTGSYYFFE